MKKNMFSLLVALAINVNIATYAQSNQKMSQKSLNVSSKVDDQRDQKSFEFSAEGDGEELTVTVIPYNDEGEVFLEGESKVFKVKTAQSGTSNQPLVQFNVPATFYDAEQKKNAQTLAFEIQVEIEQEVVTEEKHTELVTFDVNFESANKGTKFYLTGSNVLLLNASAAVQAICPVCEDSQGVIDMLNGHIEFLKEMQKRDEETIKRKDKLIQEYYEAFQQQHRQSVQDFKDVLSNIKKINAVNSL